MKKKKMTLKKQADLVQCQLVHQKSYVEFAVNEPGKGGERPINNRLKKARLTFYVFNNTSII
jgi:hypothetical protein